MQILKKPQFCAIERAWRRQAFKAYNYIQESHSKTVSLIKKPKLEDAFKIKGITKISKGRGEKASYEHDNSNLI